MPEKLRKLAFEKNDNAIVQFIRYSFVGAIATVADMGIFYILSQTFSIYYLISNIFSFLCGLFVNYVLSYIWVFNAKNDGKKVYSFALFLIIGVIGLCLNSAIIYVIVEYMGIWEFYAKAAATVIVLFWNFFARKKVVFDKKVGGYICQK